MTPISTSHRLRAALLGGLAAGALLLPTVGLAAPATAAAKEKYRYALAPVPHDPRADGGSNATGRATITVEGDRVTVKLDAKGLSPNLVHVQHIHGVGQNECPGAERRDDRVDDGLIDTVEGLPDYGAIQVSLTTSGDTSAASGLAVDRFLVADAKGRLRYERTFTLGVDFPRAIAENLDKHHIVVHGIDVNHNGAYDFGAGTSGLSSELPLEAELPAVCGLEQQHRH